MTKDTKENVANDTAQRRKLFLGGLSYYLTKDDLIKYFHQYGTIEDAVIMQHRDSGRSKGFGFVTFATLQETEACLQDSPHTLDGRQIDMKIATPKDDMPPMLQYEGDVQKRKLFIGSVDYTTTTEKLREYFSQFGTIEDCVVMKDASSGESRGFGFVTYSDVEEVDECQNKRPHVLDGRTLDTKRATPKYNKSVNENSVKRLFVGGLGSDEITDDALQGYFSKFGKIVAVEFEKYKNSSKQIGKKRNFAFIEFYDYDSVDKALMVSEHSINGWRFFVSKALPKESIRRLGRDALEMGNYLSPWSTGIMASGLEDMEYIRGNGLYDRGMAMGLQWRDTNEMYRSNLDSNMLSRVIEENLRSPNFGRIANEMYRSNLGSNRLSRSIGEGRRFDLERAKLMDVRSRQAGVGPYGGGSLRPYMRGGFRRGPY